MCSSITILMTLSNSYDAEVTVCKLVEVDRWSLAITGASDRTGPNSSRRVMGGCVA